MLKYEYNYIVIYRLYQNGNLVTKLKSEIASIKILNIDRSSIHDMILFRFLSLT